MTALDVVDAIQEAFTARLKYNRNRQAAAEAREVSWDYGGHEIDKLNKAVADAEKILDQYVEEKVIKILVETGKFTETKG